MRTDLPTGTVTFVFTDVESSTKLLRELGAERYAGALAEHRGALRAAFQAHGGVEGDTQGDALFVAFPTAEGALSGVRVGLRSLVEGNIHIHIRVRVGVHTNLPVPAIPFSDGLGSWRRSCTRSRARWVSRNVPIARSPTRSRSGREDVAR
jgi:hypothetical protein